MKTLIKLKVTPEQSVEIQKICFANKVSWPGSNYTIKFINEPYILIDSKFTLHTKCTDCLYKEVDADLFIRTNGTCEEPTNQLISSKFAEYGFAVPNFECRLYDKIDNVVFGAYFNSTEQEWCMSKWTLKGWNLESWETMSKSNYNLVPITKP